MLVSADFEQGNYQKLSQEIAIAFYSQTSVSRVTVSHPGGDFESQEVYSNP